MSKISNYLEGNWDELKGKIKRKWSKLSDDDLLSAEGSYDIFKAKLEKNYPDKINQIEDEISAFLSKNGFSDDVDFGNIKEAISSYIDEHFSGLKGKVNYLSKKTGKHAKKNPYAWLGAAAAIGFVATCLIKRK